MMFKMVFTVDREGITFHMKKHNVSEYYESLERHRAKILRGFTEKKLRGKPCPYVKGLWCWNKNCYGVPCMYANLILGKLEDRRWGCWGFHWADGSYNKPGDTENMRKFWDKMPQTLPRLSEAKPLTTRISKINMGEHRGRRRKKANR